MYAVSQGTQRKKKYFLLARKKHKITILLVVCLTRKKSESTVLTVVKLIKMSFSPHLSNCLVETFSRKIPHAALKMGQFNTQDRKFGRKQLHLTLDIGKCTMQTLHTTHLY